MSENLLFLLPFDITEVVFQFLDIKDILNLSLTCKYGNEIVGKSRNCMNQIWIKFYSFKMKDLNCLKESERCFRKLKINRISLDDHYEFLSQLTKPWRKILIYNCELRQFAQLSNILNNCTQTIEELEISDVKILTKENCIHALNFPNLKRIMFRNVDSSVIELFAGKSSSCASITFDIAQEATPERSLGELITTFLTESKSLTLLQLGPHYIKCLFDVDKLKRFEFKLEKLMLKFPIIPENSELINNNVSEFITLQSKIDWIVILELQSDVILSNIWNRSSSISHVTFIGLENLFDSMEINLAVNIKITHIELLCRKILLSQLRKILKATPNLRIIHFYFLTKNILECISKSYTNIDEVRYELIDEESEKIYENMKSERVEKTVIKENSITLKKLSFWSDCHGPFLLDPKFWHF